jgi:cobalt/nickel transport system permease protein
MHIPDGIINSPTVLVGSYAATGGITWYSLHRINKQRNPQAKVPKAALLTATFFVINLIHIPVPPASLHLVLNGLMGAVLGYYAFPAILIALFFHAVMFQHGGITTLGVNALIMGVPAILAYYIFELRHWFKGEIWTKVFAFLAGAGGVAVAALFFAATVITTISPDVNATRERQAVMVAMLAYLIPAVIEGTFTMMLASFLDRVKPELLESKYEVRT